MALTEINPPPGVYRNGVERQARGRWFDSNLVRWFEGALRPWGGWEVHASGLAGPPRAMIAWADNGHGRWIAAGCPARLYVCDRAGIVSDITPAGLTAGSADAVVGGGYGSALYGEGPYGAAGTDVGLVSACTVWSLDNFGETLVACNADDGVLYRWALDPGAAAVALSGAPVSNRALVVTDEGFILVLGAGGDPRLVQWPDQRSDSDWTVDATSQAGSFPLQTAGRLMCGRRVRAGTLLFTDIDVHLATYQGPPLIYGFERLAGDCGVISQGAAASAGDGLAVWMGRDGFFAYDGNVRPIPCEVSDHVFGDLNPVQVSKVACVFDAAFGEATWFYPSAASTENDRYVSWSPRAGHWTIGGLGRTSGVAKGVFPHPLMADAAGAIWAHEVGFDHHGATAFAESGPIEMGDGERVFTALNLIPDETLLGDVTAQFFVRFHPTGAEETFGASPAFTVANPTNVRFTGRQMRMRLTGAADSDWRVGGFRLQVRPGGRR